MGGPPVAFLLRKQTAKCNPDAEGVVAGRQGRESDLLQGEVQGSLAALLKTTGYGFGFRVHGPEVSGVESSFFEFRTKEKQFLMTTVEIPSLVRISYTSSPSLRANAQVRHSRYEYKLRWGVKFARHLASGKPPFSYRKHISLLLPGRDGWNLEVCLMIAQLAHFCSSRPKQLDRRP